MAGKGSRQRPTNHAKYAEAYDRIFGKKEQPACVICNDRGWIPATVDIPSRRCLGPVHDKEAPNGPE